MQCAVENKKIYHNNVIWSVDKADSKKSVRIKTDPARIFYLFMTIGFL